MNILVTGDFCPQLRVSSLSSLSSFFTEGIIKIIESTDYVISNQECPVVEKSCVSIEKQGPCLKGEKKIIGELKQLGFNCLTMANNHIFDYGDNGVNETIDACEKANMDFVGVGANIHEASEVLYKDFNNIKVAIINCCEHEFSIATEEHGGANPLNPITLYYQIKEAKNKANYVILIIHGGVEHFQYPTKRMVETYRFFVDAGADAIINHHQHCPCGFEIYREKPIYYGLGNFCFDWDGKRNSIWNLGYMVKLNLVDGHTITSEIFPYRQCDETPTINLLGGKELEVFNKMMKDLCIAILDNNMLDQKLMEFNSNNDFQYRKMLEPYSGRIMNGLFRRGVMPSFMNKERLLALIDFILCESHYDRLKDYLFRKLNEYENE